MKTAVTMIDKPKTDLRSDPRHIRAQDDLSRIQQQRSALVEKIGGLESSLSEPQSFGRAGLDQAALKVLGGEALLPDTPTGNRGELSVELAKAKRQLLVLDHALELAGRRIEEAAAEISVDLLPWITEENRRRNREALQLDLKRCHQAAEHQRFLTAHDADGVKALPGIQWPTDLGVLVDPYSLIRGRCREALELGIISEGELQAILEGKSLQVETNLNSRLKGDK